MPGLKISFGQVERYTIKFKIIEHLRMRNLRVRKQMLAIACMDSEMKKKILVLPKNVNEIIIKFRHYLGETTLGKFETINIIFPEQYPEKPPILKNQNSDTPIDLFLQTELLSNWNPNNTLLSILTDIYNSINDYRLSQWEFNHKKYELLTKKKSRNSLFLKQCTENETSQTKNLNKHFRTKLKEIFTECRATLPEPEIKIIEEIFETNRIGFEEIRQLLSQPQFNGKIQKEMNNGRFMHRIIKSILGTKSKKMMIKYYHVMLAAVDNPENFTCWKGYLNPQQENQDARSRDQLFRGSQNSNLSDQIEIEGNEQQSGSILLNSPEKISIEQNSLMDEQQIEGEESDQQL